MSILRRYAFLPLLTVLQLGVLNQLPLWGVVPNLFLIALTWLVFNRPVKLAFITVIVGGVVYDVYGSIFFGIHLIVSLLIGGVLSIVTRSVVPKDANPILLLGTLILVQLGYQMGVYLLTQLFVILGFTSPLSFDRFFGTTLIVALLYSSVLLYPVGSVLKKITRA